MFIFWPIFSFTAKYCPGNPPPAPEGGSLTVLSTGYHYDLVCPSNILNVGVDLEGNNACGTLQIKKTLDIYYSTEERKNMSRRVYDFVVPTNPEIELVTILLTFSLPIAEHKIEFVGGVSYQT